MKKTLKICMYGVSLMMVMSVAVSAAVGEEPRLEIQILETNVSEDIEYHGEGSTADINLVTVLNPTGEPGSGEDSLLMLVLGFLASAALCGVVLFLKNNSLFPPSSHFF